MSSAVTPTAVADAQPFDSEQDHSTLRLESPAHFMEQEVRRCLAANPGLKIDSLVVRRIDQGICLQGIVESQEVTRDACSLAQSVSGVNRVLNRLMVAPTHTVVD